MKWEKRGMIFNAQDENDMLVHHVMLPTVDVVNDEVWRIYYNGRDAQNRTRPFYIDVEAGKPENIISDKKEPVFDLGEIGSYDDCGASISTICSFNGEKLVYTGGWNVRNTVPYFCNIGMATTNDNGETWNKSRGPLFSPTLKEPYFAGSCYALPDDGVLRMYYTSCDGWIKYNDKMEPYYNIKYAESRDGINWVRNADVAVNYIDGEVSGITRPSVLKEDGKYKMWYAYRDKYDYRTNPEHSYRIGYGESTDGIHFERMDERAGIDVSEEGWDSQMICYPYVIKYNSLYYMFYNGNGFGISGFGYAISTGDD